MIERWDFMIVQVHRLALLSLLGGLLASCKALSVIPPEGVDRLSMTVTLDIEISGVGKDSIALEGSVTVHRSGPSGPDGRLMKGEMVGAIFHGRSALFGDVYATQSPMASSPCTYRYVGPGQYHGYLEIQGWFWLPLSNLLVRTEAPVKVEGVAAAIPPVGQKAETMTRDIPLLDIHKPQSPPIGTLSRATGEIHAVIHMNGE